ncbi:EamA family transporter [Actinokineospora terrae]
MVAPCRWSLLLVLAAAGSWAVGNVCTRMAQPDDGFRVTIWSCLIPPVPLFLLSIATEGADRGITAIADADITTWLALGYVVVFATILALGVWSMLLGRYPAHKVVPFALLIPVVGIPTGWLVEGDVVTLPMLAGALVLLAGLYFVTIRARVDRDTVASKGMSVVLRRSSTPRAVDHRAGTT